MSLKCCLFEGFIPIFCRSIDAWKEIFGALVVASWIEIWVCVVAGLQKLWTTLSQLCYKIVRRMSRFLRFWWKFRIFNQCRVFSWWILWTAPILCIWKSINLMILWGNWLILLLWTIATVICTILVACWHNWKKIFQEHYQLFWSEYLRWLRSIFSRSDAPASTWTRQTC